jgi:hypothetical protein
MKAIHWIIAAAALAFVLPEPADAATTDPEVIIYRFPGVRDDGSADFVGVARSAGARSASLDAAKSISDPPATR